jgi:hypothetical protein
MLASQPPPPGDGSWLYTYVPYRYRFLNLLQIAMPPTALLLPHNCEHAVHTDAPARLVAPAMIPTGKPNVCNTASIPPYEKPSCVVYSAFSPLHIDYQSIIVCGSSAIICMNVHMSTTPPLPSHLNAFTNHSYCQSVIVGQSLVIMQIPIVNYIYT